jgi:beta-galactosidase
MRGFCEHASWGGVGAAVPPRVDLLRLQQLRGVGGNALRTSHNPPAPQLLDIADRLGVLVLDENRVLAHLDNVRGGAECGPAGCRNIPHYAGDIAGDAGALARRDRLHASVVWYSICSCVKCTPRTRPKRRCKPPPF